MIRSTLAAGFALAIIAAPAAAQCDTDNEYMDVVRQQAIAAGSTFGEEGYSLVQVLCGSLNEDAESAYDTSIGQGSEVAWVAVCDQDCDDIDLRLFDNRGNLLASDTEVDDFPIVTYGPGGAMTGMKIEVGMYSCSVEPCYYAIAMFSRGEQEGEAGWAPVRQSEGSLSERFVGINFRLPFVQDR